MRVLITGASRGIGAATARAFARNHPHAQIAIVARSLSKPSHAGLRGTLLHTAREVEALGSAALPLEADMRDAKSWTDCLDTILNAFGGIDVLVNNASALWTDRDATAKKMDLLHAVNTRATLLAIQHCRPSLEEAKGSIVTISPPIRLGRLEYIAAHPAYTISKYGMTLATLGAACESVRANTLWPSRTVATAATEALEKKGVIPGAFTKGRDPSHVGDAVHMLAVTRKYNACMLLDEEVLELPKSNAPLDAFVEDVPSTHFPC